MPEKNKSRERSERELLEEIRSLLILLVSKSGATSEEIGKCLGVGGSRVRNILSGFGKNKTKDGE